MANSRSRNAMDPMKKSKVMRPCNTKIAMKKIANSKAKGNGKAKREGNGKAKGKGNDTDNDEPKGNGKAKGKGNDTDNDEPKGNGKAKGKGNGKAKGKGKSKIGFPRTVKQMIQLSKNKNKLLRDGKIQLLRDGKNKAKRKGNSLLVCMYVQLPLPCMNPASARALERWLQISQ